MPNQLELRSTFQLTGESISNIGVPSEAILENPYKKRKDQYPENLQETHKKNNFAVATTISQSIFNGLGKDLRNSTESYCSKKLASKINKSFNQNLNHVSIKDIEEQLNGYDFNCENSFDEGVSTKFCVKKGAHSGHVIFHIPAFVPQNDLKVPKDATNFKICARLIAVSDFEKNGNDFHTTNIRQHGQTFSFQTTMLPLLRITTQPITAQLRINNPGFSPVGMSSVVVLGVKYYTYDKKKFTQLEECTRTKILKVY
ncbi:MAG: hypothetical protein JXR07_12865 [Reichenbachiella sp.]